MKKTNLTFHKKHAFNIFGWLFILLGAYSTQAQCSLACNGMTNISLDNMTSNCQAEITVAMVADVSGCPSGDFSVIVNDNNGNPIADAIVTSDYIGQTLEVVVLDATTNNSCWGSIYIEDKLPPVMDCNQAPTDITCFELQNFVPVATDNCDTNLDIIKTKPDSIVVNNCDTGLSDEILKTVFVTYVAVDDQGLSSEECTFEFSVLRIQNFDEIARPSSLLLQDETHLECDSLYNKLPNGLPSPLDLVIPGQPTVFGTGVPTIGGVELFPNSFQDCNLLVTYVDTELPPIGCAKKIMRRWDIFEWSCSSPQRDTSMIQMIEIVDSEGPVVTCPADYTISTNGSSCEASVILPAIGAVDNCSTPDQFTYGVSYGNGPALITNGGLAQLNLGENLITYSVYDECLNLTSCSFTITVEDKTPPVVICDQFTVIALTSDGCAYIHASVFDDGSYDECSDITLSVRRMDNGVPCDTDSNCTGEDDEFFDDYVRFCCIDQGTDDLMVVLRATDAQGNVNDCMVNVEVQDKLAPTIACPAPVTVNCDFAYDVANLASFFGDAVISDNCGVLEPTDVINTDGLNQCNIGTAVRTISIGTPGAANYSFCTQTITFIAIDEFNDGVDDSEPDTDITWPTDVLLNGCEDPTGAEYLPANLPVLSQFPTYVEGACDLVGANYEDQIFPFNNPNGDACFKIVRTWTVIDWCQFDTDSSGSTSYPSWTYTQIIKVNDDEGPTDIVLSGPSSVCTFDSECADGAIELGATSSDICTQALDWSYTIFTDGQNDGKLDDILVINNVAQSFNGFGANSINASGTYPIGTHKVLYTFSDKCGNVTSKEFEFSIVNCKAPTAYCHNGLAVDLMEDGNGGGTVQLWATDFDAGSSHPCGYQVYVSFDSIVVSATGNIDAGNGILINVNNGKEYTCDNLGDNFVDIWAGVVSPEGNIIQSYCTASLNVQDNMGICPAGSGVNVEGIIATASDVELNNAEVTLLGSGFAPTMTSENGSYAFPAMPVGGAYSISPLKNDDYTNGVSTLDLVMIQRHILGLESLDSPYKMIAADINNDEDLSAGDLLQLRKLILGTISELPNNGSWRFIDAEFTFADVTDPFAETLPESYDIETLNADMNIDFVAVKVGDINDNVNTNLTGEKESSSRSANTVEMTVENQSFEAGNTITVPVRLTEEMIATGLQFTVKTGAAMDFAGINSDAITISDNNVGFASLSEGIITLSWNHATGVALLSGEAVIELVFNTTKAGSLAADLDITSDVINAEIYNNELESMDIDFIVEGRDAVVGEFVLYQNTPNPFTEATEITFELPYTEEGSLTVYDMTGKIVTRIQRTFEKGTNQITLTREDLTGSGVLYYQLEVGEYNASRKMILID